MSTTHSPKVMPPEVRQKLVADMDRSLKMHQDIVRHIASGDEAFDLLVAWTAKEKLDLEIAATIRKYMTAV